MPARSAICLTALLPLVLAIPASAAQQDPGSLGSYRRARAVLDQAIAAHGGLERLRGITTLVLRHEGQFFNRNQSHRVAPPYDPTPSNGRLVVDQPRGRLLWETETGFPGGFRNRSRVVLAGADSWNANLIERRWFRVEGPQATNIRLGVLRRLPRFLLLNALERSTQLRSLGEATFKGKPHDVVTYAGEDGQQLTLYFDRATHLLSKYDQVYTDPQTGDALAEIVYPGYRPVDGMPFPIGRQLWRVGEMVEDVRFLDPVINGPLPDSVFARPADLVDGTGGPNADTTARRLAPDAWVVGGVAGSNSVVAAFNDYVLVFEPYGNDAASRRVIEKVKELAPGKSIRYVAPTHHHDDHTGGLRTYIAEGATVLSTPGNQQYFERMTRATYTLAPDAPARAPQTLKFEVIQGKKRVLEDSNHRLELIDIGPSPHADEMVVAYFPQHKLLVQGDLLNLPWDGRVTPGNLTTAHFAQWLERSGLAVETIVAVHGPTATVAQLKEAVSKADR